MKICVLTHTFPRNIHDSAAAFMKEFCDGLVENGNKVIVVTPFDQKFLRTGDSFKIITYKYIWPKRLHLLGYSRSMEADVALKKINFLLLPFLFVSGLITTWKVVREEKIDIISVHWILPNGLIALIISKVTGVPYVVTMPGTDAYLAYKNKLFGWIAKLVAKNSSGLFSNSRWHLERILHLGVKSQIEKVITYPVDVNKFKPTDFGIGRIRKKHHLTEDNLVILAVGRLVYKKGFEYLIQAMQQIVKEYPNIRLIIGGDGDLFHQLKQLIADLGLSTNILLIGAINRDEILYYYNLADIMVTPSIVDEQGNVDGRPLVILESMACAKPQIVTNLPGIADSLIDEENAILVPQKDVYAISQALDKLLSSKQLRVKMGKKNRKMAEEILSTKSVGKQYTDSFNKILS